MNTSEALLEAIKSLVLPDEKSSELDLEKNFFSIWCGKMSPSSYTFVSKNQRKEYKNRGSALSYFYKFKQKYQEDWCCVVKSNCNGKADNLKECYNMHLLMDDVREFAETFKKES